MLKTWLIYVLTLIAAFIFFLFYKMWVAWYCLVLLLMLPVIALIMCLISSSMFRWSDSIPKVITNGTPACVTIDTNGIASLISFCRFKVNIKDVMGGGRKNAVSLIKDGGKTTIPIDTSHCGAYEYRISDIRIYDLFGFFFFRRIYDKKYDVVVQPVSRLPEVMPDLNGFRAKSLRKSSNSYSEIYDIREYTAGDPVRSIHWKMSAKKDKLLIKEPQEECYGHARIYLRLTGDRSALDDKLGELLFTSSYFLDHDILHKIRIIPPNKRELSFDIESKRDLDKAISRILRMKIPEGD